MHKIIVDVSPTGETKIKVEGVSGKSCKDLTKAIESALGETVKDTPTGEMYGNASQAQPARR